MEVRSSRLQVVPQEVFNSCGTLPSVRLMLKTLSIIPQSWSAQDLRNLELMSPGYALIFLSSFLTWFVVRDNLEQWAGMLDGVGGGAGLVVMSV